MKELKTIYKNVQPYIIVVFITISFTTFIMLGASDSSFVENFNFASTITSIILSIIAILITLIDGEKNSNILDKIIQATSNINESTKSLNIASDRIEFFINKLDETEKNILNETKLQSEGVKEAVFTMIEEKELFQQQTQHLFNSGDLNIEFDKMLYSLPYSIRQYCLFVYESYKYKGSISISSFDKFYKKELKKDNRPMYDTYEGIRTTLYMLKGFNLIDFEFDDNNYLIVTYFDDIFKNAINAVIPSEEYYADAPDLIFFGSVHKYFKTLD